MEKEYILDLIDARSYHSCIITTYSYDFLYFEKRMISRLHSKNIKNINVFVDAQILDRLLGKLSGNNNYERRYSLIPIEGQGCFHPKIYMFFGEKSGLIIIGSGNITACGQGINDEIWGAFRYDIENKQYENLFASVVSYLNYISSEVKGFNKEKLEWIHRYSPWIANLPIPELKFEEIEDGDAICLVTSGNDTDINKCITELKINFQNIKSFTAISPYFDEQGSLIESFVTKLSSIASVRIIMEEKTGFLPLKMSKAIKQRCEFYKWEDCRPNIDKSYKQLHAKIFIFEMQDGINYCLFGSSNASVAAIGINGKHAINYEASLILKTKRNVIKNLGIKLDSSKKCELEGLEKFNKRACLNSNTNFTYNNWLYEIDKTGNQLFVYTKKTFDTSKWILRTFDCWGELCEKYSLKQTADYYVGKTLLGGGQHAMYGQLWDEKLNVATSNKQMIQDEYVLYKTNPNPELVQIDRIISEMNSNPNYLLRKIAESAFYDDTETTSVKTGGLSSQKFVKPKATVQGTILTQKEYENLSTIKKSIYDLESSRSSMIMDYLKRMYIEKKEQSDIEDYAEEEMPSDDNDTSKYGKSTEIVYKKSDFDLENRAAKKIFQGYYSHIKTEVIKAIEKDEKDYTISYTELKKFNILLYLIVYYSGKEFIYTDEEGKEHTERIIYLKNNEQQYSLCNLCLDMIESFLTLCLRDFRTYNDEYIEKKMQELRDDAFYHIIFCLYNGKWNSDFEKCDDMILLNAIHYLAYSPADKLLNKITLLSKINNIYNSLKGNKLDNLSAFIAQKVASYKQPYQRLKEDIGNKKLTDIKYCNNEDIVFINKVTKDNYECRCGFCLIDEIRPNDVLFYRVGIKSLCSDDYLINKRINKNKMYVLKKKDSVK